MVTHLEWNSSWVHPKIEEAVVEARHDTAMVARGMARWRHVAASVFSEGGMVGAVGAAAKDAKYLEFGTRPHEIAPGPNEPRAKQALKFKGGGFARGPVPHPGQKAEPFLRPAAATFLPRVAERIRRNLG